MNKFFALILLFVSLTVQGETKKLDTEHFQVEYDEETEDYVTSSLKILNFVRSKAIKSGFYFPDKLKFSVVRSDRNVLYFDYKHLKGITWEYNSLTNFLPPKDSGKKNVYGLCHEMGHLSMFYLIKSRNNWMTKEHRESWADFFGNHMVDLLYQEFGEKLWLESHNYKETAGTDFLKKRLIVEKNRPELKEFIECCYFWWELNEKIGFDKMSLFFKEIRNNKVDNPEANEKYFNVLTSFIDDDNLQPWYNKYAEYLIRPGS